MSDHTPSGTCHSLDPPYLGKTLGTSPTFLSFSSQTTCEFLQVDCSNTPTPSIGLRKLQVPLCSSNPPITPLPFNLREWWNKNCNYAERTKRQDRERNAEVQIVTAQSGKNIVNQRAGQASRSRERAKRDLSGSPEAQTVTDEMEAGQR